MYGREKGQVILREQKADKQRHRLGLQVEREALRGKSGSISSHRATSKVRSLTRFLVHRADRAVSQIRSGSTSNLVAQPAVVKAVWILDDRKFVQEAGPDLSILSAPPCQIWWPVQQQRRAKPRRGNPFTGEAEVTRQEKRVRRRMASLEAAQQHATGSRRLSPMASHLSISIASYRHFRGSTVGRITRLQRSQVPSRAPGPTGRLGHDRKRSPYH